MKNPNLKSLLAFTMLSTRTAPMCEFVTDMDRKVLRRRASAEGVPFLCVLLPRLGKALEAALELGAWTTPTGFQNQKDNGRPLLFQDAFNLIFDEACVLRKGVDVKHVAKAVLAVRQLTLAHGKCDFGGVNPAHVAEAWSSFKENQARLRSIDLPSVMDTVVDMGELGMRVPVKAILREAKKLVHRLLANCSIQDMRFTHGAGATTYRSQTPQRYDVHRHVYNRHLDRVIPYSDVLFSGATHLSDELHLLERMREVDEFYDLASFVSKTTEKVRGISKIHPTPMFFGQGCRSVLEDAMGSPQYRKELDIRDQTRNKDLALLGSITQLLCTIDLADASDSLKWEIPLYLFPEPICSALFATRSAGTSFNGETVEYACFAPMGSPTCFPVQTICFWAIVKAATRFAMPGKKNQVVSVYGDDIICPTSAYSGVTKVLELLGLKVNHTKSFHKGLFRESCGGDYYGGVDVSVVRCKKVPLPTYIDDDIANSVLRYADLYSRFIRRYKVSSFEEVYNSIRLHLRSVVPCGLPEIYCADELAEAAIANSSCLPTDGYTYPRGFPVKWNKRLQRREITLLTVKPATVNVVARGDKAFRRGDVMVRSGWSLLVADLCRSMTSEHNDAASYAADRMREIRSVSTRNEHTPRDSNVASLRSVPISWDMPVIGNDEVLLKTIRRCSTPKSFKV